MNKLSVSVLIAAYNEESTIGHILSDILDQETQSFNLQQIIVVTDGCDDQTATQVRMKVDPRIILVENTIRKGKVACLEQAMDFVTSEIIIQLDADIRLGHQFAFDKLITPLQGNSTIGLTCGEYLPWAQDTFVSKIAYTGLKMFGDIKNSLGIKALRYRCNGRMLALRTLIARTISFKSNCPHDVYTFYHVIDAGYNAVFCPEAISYYWVVNTWRDYFKQHVRYMRVNAHLYFPTIHKQYTTITFPIKVKYCLYALVNRKYPLSHIFILIPFYFLIYVSSYVQPRSIIWPIAYSSKKPLIIK